MEFTIANILPSVLESAKKQAPSGFEVMTRAWETAVGAEQSEHSEPYALRGKILFVRVDDSTRAFELSRRFKRSLIRRIQHAVGEDKLEDIVFRVGELARSRRKYNK